jgi:leader peptidase (prepilin peptidase)/N-methyltransferase
MIGGPAAFIAAVLLGLIFGSLATALSYRLPRGLPIAADRSRCSSCGATLGARDLVPLLSWMASRGRCRQCGASVSWRYPAIEAVTALLFAGAWAASGGDPLRAALLALTGFALVVITVADLEERIIPDVMLIFMLPLAAGWRAITDRDWLDAGLGALFGIGVSLLLRWFFQRFRGKTALGLGDVKFLGVAGIYLGLQDYGRFLVLAGVAGIVLGLAWRGAGKGPVFPFGPALCLAMAAGLLGFGH